MQRSCERNCLSYVFQAANPGHSTLDSHAKSTVWHAAILPQIEIPLEGFFRQSMLANALQKQLVRCHALRATDNFAVTLRREHVNTQSQLRTLRVRFHVKRFHLCRVAMNHHRLLELGGQIGLIGRTEITAPLKLCFESTLCVSLLQHFDGFVVADPGKWS